MTNVLAFIVVLGVLIFFHELGHFLAARLMGVGVETFSLGFGPRLIGKKIGITDYRIAALPLGGYVKMVGEEPDAELTPEQIPISFTHKPLYKRFLIVAAGPLSNLLLAVVIFFCFFRAYGIYELKPVVGEVQKDMPAETAGLQKGDLIVAIDGKPVNWWSDMTERIIGSEGKELRFDVKREDGIHSFIVKPRETVEKMFGTEVKHYLIGIVSSSEAGTKRALSTVEAVKESVTETGRVTKYTLMGFWKLLSGQEDSKNLGGPILVAQMAGFYAKKGVAWLIDFIAKFSIMLGLLNFLPIPVLDGGHLMFFTIEAVTRKPVNEKLRMIAQQAGVFMLLLLMVFAFYNDIARIISG